MVKPIRSSQIVFLIDDETGRCIDRVPAKFQGATVEIDEILWTASILEGAKEMGTTIVGIGKRVGALRGMFHRSPDQVVGAMLVSELEAIECQYDAFLLDVQEMRDELTPIPVLYKRFGSLVRKARRLRRTLESARRSIELKLAA